MARLDLSLVRPLPLRVQHNRYETAHSLLCRLAARNGNKSVRQLLQRAPNLSGFITNFSRDVEISLAAQLSGNNRAKIEKSTPLRSGRKGCLGSYQGPVDTNIFRICSHCLANDTDNKQTSDSDAQAYVRDFWHFGAIKYCPAHGVKMRARCKRCNSQISRSTLFGCHCSCGADVRSTRCTQVRRYQINDILDVLRQMDRMPDVPYWSLGGSPYPPNMKWTLGNSPNTEFSKRQLMVLGSQLLRPNFKHESEIDASHFYQAAASFLSRTRIQTRKQTIASHFL